jgi:hypothetical protein
MSTGAVFKLIANDGKADRLIMATALLNQRIKDVMCARAAAGKEDPTPTLVDIEHTHILYVNAHFKPYAAIGFEYNKVRPTGSGATLDSRLTFSIPQFGDFFHDMVLRVRLGATSAAAGPLPIAGGPYIPATLISGVNNAPVTPAASTGATLYANFANRATQSTTSPLPLAFTSDPVSGTPIGTMFTSVPNGVLARYAALAPAVPYDQQTYILITNIATQYWTLANVNTYVKAPNVSVAAASARTYINSMFQVALSKSNPSFSVNMTQQKYNSIAAGTIFGIYDGFMTQIQSLSVADYTFVISAAGNAYLGYIYDTINQSFGTAWTVPQFVQYGLVDAFGNYIEVPALGTSPNTYRNFVRYCEFPGNRLIAGVRFDVNGNPLDQYTANASVMLEKFTVPTHKRVGYNRLVGQAVPLSGTSGPTAASVRDADAARTPGGIGRWAATQSNSTVALFAPGPAEVSTNYVGGSLIDPSIPANITLNQYAATQVDVGQRVINWVNGPQTPKPVQAPLELWHRLRFWFCDDVRLSVPSVAIPFGQRFISVDLASAVDLLSEFPSLYLQTVTSAPLLTLSDNQLVIAAQRTVTHTPIQQLFGFTAPVVEAAELYINNIFVNPEVHDIYIKRIGFSLIRVYREQQTGVNRAGGDRELLSQLKWPIEYMYVGIQPDWNTSLPTVTGGNRNAWRDWHRMTRQVDATEGTFCTAQVPIVASQTSFSQTASTDGDIQTTLNSPSTPPSTYTQNGSIYSVNIVTNTGTEYIPAAQLIGTTNTSGTVTVTNSSLTTLGINSAIMFGNLCVNLINTTTIPAYTILGIYGVPYLNSGSITSAGFQTLNSHLINSVTIPGVTDPTAIVGSRFGQVVPDQYWLNVPTVDSMSLVAHGVTIYDDFQDLFYSGYTPYQYGCANVTTPEDPGAFLVNMALFPRSYQPSGHLNVSRARETYLVWNSSYVSPKTPAQLIVVAIAINFLLVSDGSATLRYST